MKYMLSLLFLVLVLPLAGRIQSERAYQEWFADKHGGKMEVVMKDGTRCDVVTATHAIEVDFGEKWAEAIGQSLNYALQAKKKAGIVLIMERQSDYRYYLRLDTIIKRHGLKIDLWPVYAYKGEGLAGGVAPLPPTLSETSGDGRPTHATAAGKYWITSTGKTHNASCRYFGRTKTGKYVGKGSGNDCKICGGARW